MTSHGTPIALIRPGVQHKENNLDSQNGWVEKVDAFKLSHPVRDAASMSNFVHYPTFPLGSWRTQRVKTIALENAALPHIMTWCSDIVQNAHYACDNPP